MDPLEMIPVPNEVAECKSCLKTVQPADHFCQSCGFPVKGTEEEQGQFFYNRNYQQLQINSLDQKIKSAGTTMYVLAAVFFVYGLVYFFVNSNNEQSNALLITNAGVAVIFLLLGAWAGKKPLAAIISGMVLFGLLQILAAIENPVNLFSGIIFKIIIISYLIKGLSSALEAEKIKKQYHI